MAIEAAKLAKKKAAAAAKKGKKGKSKKAKKAKKKASKKDNAEEEVLSGTLSPTISTPQNEVEDNDPEDEGSDGDPMRNTIKFGDDELQNDDISHLKIYD